MKCNLCGEEIRFNNLILDDFNNCYCLNCGEFFGEIIERTIEEKSNRKYKAIIKFYIK